MAACLLTPGCDEPTPAPVRGPDKASEATERSPKPTPEKTEPPKVTMTLPVASESVVPEFKFDIVVTIEDGKCRAESKILRNFPPPKYGSLFELGVALSLARTVHKIYEKRRGRTGLERVGDAMGSTLRVLIRAERDTPWEHIAFVKLILVEEKYHRLWLACHPCATAAYSDDEVQRFALKRCSTAPPETALRLYGVDPERSPNVTISADLDLEIDRKPVPSFQELPKAIEQAASVAGANPRGVFVKPKRATPLYVVVACLNAAKLTGREPGWPTWFPGRKKRRLPALPMPTNER